LACTTPQASTPLGPDQVNVLLLLLGRRTTRENGYHGELATCPLLHICKVESGRDSLIIRSDKPAMAIMKRPKLMTEEYVVEHRFPGQKWPYRS
jgi:hypothetical protein